jgi:hypothetical protein
MKTLDEFKKEVLDFAENKAPKSWRKGQAVFNYIDRSYGVARALQFEKHIDCFFNDDLIDEFINAAYKEYYERTKN